MEAALVFDRRGDPIYWHAPPDRSQAYLPDSRDLWAVLWENREQLGGVAHTHPWNGSAGPSQTDVTTFAAVETGLGRRLLWPIVTFTEIVWFEWVGPGRLDYAEVEHRRVRIWHGYIQQLREMSR